MKKISGTKTVIVPIVQVGKNYFPFVEDLRDKYIKYIDYVEMGSLPDIPGTPLTGNNGYLTITGKSGNIYLYNDIPLKRFNLSENKGVRVPIMDKLSMQNSFIRNTDSDNNGKFAVLVFYYDDPNYSARNKTTETVVDGFEIPMVSNVGKNQFPDNRTMVDKRFRRFNFTTPAFTPTEQTGVTSTEADNIYLTFQKGNYKIIDNLPLKVLYEVDNIDFLEFSNIKFDFTYSYAVFGYNQPNSNRVIYLNAEYEK